MNEPREVWKFPLPVPGPDVFGIELPAGAEVLTVQVQAGRPCIWALVSPSAPPEGRLFRIAGTGHPIAERLGAYVGTFQFEGPGLVFHLFEVAL